MRIIKVLLVEDNSHLEQLLVAHPAAPGITLELRPASGRGALAGLAAGGFDVAIVDVDLPGLDGAEVLRRVGRELGAAVPIVAVSAGGETARAALAAGADTVLARPVDAAELFGAVLGFGRAPADGPRPARLLLLDDSDFYRTTLTALLEDLGYEIVEARSLSEARQLMRHGRYDLAILDVQLEDGYGSELIPELREHAPATRLLLLSGEPQTEHHADLMLEKSISPDELLRQIAELLRSPPGGG